MDSWATPGRRIAKYVMKTIIWKKNNNSQVNSFERNKFAKLGRHASPIMICVRCDHHHSFLATVLVSHCGEVLFWGRYIVRFPRAPRGTISQQYIQYMYFRYYIMIFSLYGHTVVVEADSLALFVGPWAKYTEYIILYYDIQNIL